MSSVDSPIDTKALFAFRYKSEGWEDIPDYGPVKIVCHICLGISNVKQGGIPVSSDREEVNLPGIEKKHIVNYLLNCRRGPCWTFWQLCQTCYDRGWRPPEEVRWGYLLYTNSFTQENRAI